MQDVCVLPLKGPVPLTIVNLNKVERFALSQEPIAFQIQFHINNAQLIVDPKTQITTEYSVKDVLGYLEYIIQFGPTALFAYLDMKDRHLLGFRCAQIVQYYGVIAVVDYIELVYGRKMIVFGKEQANERRA